MIRPSREEAEKYFAYYRGDTDFAAFGRLLQSKWRQEKGFPFAHYGNSLPVDFAKSSKANFITDNIRQLIEPTIKEVRAKGGVIKEPRIWDNLLSSQPLCFNLFGELSLDMPLATKFFHELFPNKVLKVTQIKFEFSPGRRTLHCDNSAFDVFIEYSNYSRENCFIGIEVKYAECLKEETKKNAQASFEKHHQSYSVLTSEEIFKPGAINSLQLVPLSQIWRDHLLALSSRNIYNDGFLVYLFPKANSECQKGVNDYMQHLQSGDEAITQFAPRYLETFINTLKKLHPEEWTYELERRYLGEALNKVIRK
jgi:hypothetical protein